MLDNVLEFLLFGGLCIVAYGFVREYFNDRKQTLAEQAKEAAQREIDEAARRSEQAAAALLAHQNQLLNSKLNITSHELARIPKNYDVHRIPKKTGGVRTLHIPNPELKSLQKRILLSILYTQSSHKFSYAFKKRKSIVDNARPHCDQQVIVKLDIRNFFPSITLFQVSEVFVNAGWDPTIAERLALLCCHKGALPQGAPSSPALSNLILKNIDVKLTHLAIRNGAKYSRYADDMTFSFSADNSKAIGAIIKVTQKELRKVGFDLNFKRGKIRVLRRHQHQEICGITVNTEKPTLTRKKRRLLRAVKYRLDNNLSATMSRDQLNGWENFNRMIEQNPKITH